MIRTIALDLGTHTGWAVLNEGRIESGTLHLATEKELALQRRNGLERSLDIRFVRFVAFLRDQVRAGVGRLVFEDVMFRGLGSTQSTQLWASLRTAMWALKLDHPDLQVVPVPVNTLKAFATGLSHCKKPEMAKALVKAARTDFRLDKRGNLLTTRSPRRLLDDNEIDAIWLARFTLAVDRGEGEFLSVFDRRQRKKEVSKAFRARVRENKARKERLRKEKIAKRQTVARAKATGRCCGLFRKPTTRGRAFCPKCLKTVRMPRATKPPVA